MIHLRDLKLTGYDIIIRYLEELFEFMNGEQRTTKVWPLENIRQLQMYYKCIFPEESI
jgi:hypothetical protein